MVWRCKTVILIQDNGPDVDLSAIRSKCLVERDGEVVERCDSGVRKAQGWLGQKLENVEGGRQVQIHASHTER